MNINAKIIARIKELQQARNWSTNHLASEAELSAATITNWYKRKTIPSIKAISGLCDAFGITISEFFNETITPVELTIQQKELLSEWDLFHKKQKENLLTFIKATNRITKESNPL